MVETENRATVSVTAVVMFFSSDSGKSPCQVEKSDICVSGDIYEDLNKFRHFLRRYLGLENTAMEVGLGRNFTVKLACLKSSRSTTGQEAFSVNTQEQWAVEKDAVLWKPGIRLRGLFYLLLNIQVRSSAMERDCYEMVLLKILYSHHISHMWVSASHF